MMTSTPYKRELKRNLRRRIMECEPHGALGDGQCSGCPPFAHLPHLPLAMLLKNAIWCASRVVWTTHAAAGGLRLTRVARSEW